MWPWGYRRITNLEWESTMSSIADLRAAVDDHSAKVKKLLADVSSLKKGYDALKASGGLSEQAQSVLDSVVQDISASSAEVEGADADVAGDI